MPIVSDLVSIPKGSIKRPETIVLRKETSKFQFQKVRLKVA